MVLLSVMTSFLSKIWVENGHKKKPRFRERVRKHNVAKSCGQQKSHQHKRCSVMDLASGCNGYFWAQNAIAQNDIQRFCERTALFSLFKTVSQKLKFFNGNK
jgi:hypothetical protein